MRATSPRGVFAPFVSDADVWRTQPLNLLRLTLHRPDQLNALTQALVEAAARLGIGALTFAFISEDEARQWVHDYYETFKRECVPIGHTVNPNVAMVSGFSVHPDRAEADAAARKLASLPPLVTSWEVERLREQLSEAEEGRRFVLQGGDCAEMLTDCSSTTIANSAPAPSRCGVVTSVTRRMTHSVALLPSAMPTPPLGSLNASSTAALGNGVLPRRLIQAAVSSFCPLAWTISVHGAPVLARSASSFARALTIAAMRSSRQRASTRSLTSSSVRSREGVTLVTSYQT